MKKFETPRVEIEEIEFLDVIATSTGSCPENTQLPCIAD